MLILPGVLAALTVFDIVIHVAADQVEALRITGNIIVLAASLVLLAVPSMRRAGLAIVAGAGNLVLNLVFIAREGIGTLGWILVGATTVLCVALAVRLAGRGDAAA
jgi:hypothetical protein